MPLGSPYVAAGAALLLLGTHTGAFFVGKDYGADGVRAEQAEELEQALKDKKAAEQRIADLELAAQNKEVIRETTVREINRDVPRIVTRDIYHNVCIDVDGVQLLDRAAEAANGRFDTGAPSGAAAGNAKDATESGRND